MTQPAHLRFLRENRLRAEMLPEPIRELMALYQSVERQARDRTGDSRECLLALLHRWDSEILTELQQEIETEATARRNDRILSRYFKQGKTTQLMRSELIEAGFSGPLKKYLIDTPNYRLRRTGMFTYSFSLEKKSKNM